LIVPKRTILPLSMEHAANTIVSCVGQQRTKPKNLMESNADALIFNK